MTRFEALQAQRRAAHRSAADAAWATLRAELDDAGIDCRLFGSFSKPEGSFLEHSDIDLMIMGKLPAERRLRVRSLVQKTGAEAGVDVDLHFAQDLTRESCEALLAD